MKMTLRRAEQLRAEAWEDYRFAQRHNMDADLECQRKRLASLDRLITGITQREVLADQPTLVRTVGGGFR